MEFIKFMGCIEKFLPNYSFTCLDRQSFEPIALLKNTATVKVVRTPRKICSYLPSKLSTNLYLFLFELQPIIIYFLNLYL